MRPSSTMPRPTLIELAYVLGVTAVAASGFATGSTPTILLAAAVVLPASAVALPAYYVAYGLLALVPGANPSTSTGSGSCLPHDGCHASTSAAAGWFTLATDAVGILALVAAAVVNVVLVRIVLARRATRTRTLPSS